MIKINIVKNDTKVVAKAVIIDNNDRVLFLKRSQKLEKFPGEWDLPGGHVKEGEPLMSGLKREVAEETSLEIDNVRYIEQIKNMYFFMCKYDSQPVKISDEHIDYKFLEESDLDKKDKFQQIAKKALRIQNG